MEMEGCQEIDLELEADGLIDDSQFSGAVNTENGIGLSINENDHLPELHDFVDPGRTKKNGRYNLRKSLAWDSAFFTSAGVLDAEELTSMITRADKEKHFLPGIQEDITGSTESISTHESDNLTLESLDDDLFLDIRASIQRSSEKASKSTNSSTKSAAEVVDSAAISSLRKQELVSQHKNPKPVLKKNSGLEAVRMPKCQPKQNSGKLGSVKAAKQDFGHSQMPSTAKSVATNTNPPKLPTSAAAAKRESAGTSRAKSVATGTKPPKLPTSAAAAKRESVGTSRFKSDLGNSKPATIPSDRTQPPKVSAPRGARRALPKPALQTKSSLSSSSNTSRMDSTRSSTSSDSSSNTSSGASSKSTLVAARRNPGKSSNVGTSSIPKTPSKTGLKNKPASSTLSASVSPASSISEWSSASSSSSMVNQRCSNSRTSLDTSSGRPVDADSRNHIADQNADRNKSHTVVNNSRRSTQSGTIHAPGKPSGLRMPSPKIGFFDGVKSGTRTPNGAPISSPIRCSNSKLKSAKTPTTRTAFSSASIKLGSPKAASPASSQEKSHASVDASDMPKDVKDPLASFEEKSHVAASDMPKDVKDSLASFEEKSHTSVDASYVPTNEKDHPASLEEKSRTSVGASDFPTDTKVSVASFGESLHALADASDVPTDAKVSSASFEEKSYAFTIASVVPTDMNDSAASLQEKSHALVKTSLVNASGFATDVKDCPHTSLGVNGNATGESCQQAKNVQSEDAVNRAIIMKENSSDFDLNKNAGSVDIKNPSVEVANASGSENIDHTHHLEKIFNPVDVATDKGDSCANYQGEKLQGDSEEIYHNDQGLSDNLLSDTSEPALSLPPTVSESAASRTPLAPKNSFCSNECVDVPKQASQVAVPDKTSILLPSTQQKENS